MMLKLKILLALMCSVILIAGCNRTNTLDTPTKIQSIARADEQITDNRMSDLAIIEHDPELYFGDLGVEQLLEPLWKLSFNQAPQGDRHQVLPQKATEPQSLKMSALLAPNGFPLIESFPDEAIVPINGSYVENVIQTAESYKGIPYEYGSDRTNPSSFDCSDFTRWAYLYALGVDLPWDSRSQAAYVEAFSKRKYKDLSKARRGDLLFFTRYLGNRRSDYLGLKPDEKPISHMGIYLGNNKIIHSASKETGGVRIDQIRWKHLEYRFLFGAGVLN